MSKFTSVKHICQATQCAELRRQLLADGKHKAAVFWTDIRVQKLYDAEIERRREELKLRVNP